MSVDDIIKHWILPLENDDMTFLFMMTQLTLVKSIDEILLR